MEALLLCHVERRDAATNLISFIGFTFLSNWPRHGDEIYRYTFATPTFFFRGSYIKSSPLTFLLRKSGEGGEAQSCFMQLRILTNCQPSINSSRSNQSSTHSFDAAIRTTTIFIYVRFFRNIASYRIDS